MRNTSINTSSTSLQDIAAPCELLRQQYLQRLNSSQLQNWHEFWLYRCLELGLCGQGRVSPNPLVGAVIVRPKFPVSAFPDSAALGASTSSASSSNFSGQNAWQSFIDSPQAWPALPTLPAQAEQQWSSYFELLGQGYHAACGQLHAEATAFADAQVRGHTDFRGAILYCNLEPCCYQAAGKRQPPCSEQIIRQKLSAVVFANIDPNPAVAGKGAQGLRSAGLAVRCGDLALASAMVNQVFFRQMQNPSRNGSEPGNEAHSRSSKIWVSLKLAQSLDGRIATKNGHSQWISGPRARTMVQALRAGYGAAHSAVAVGRGTLEADNPSLLLRTPFLEQLSRGGSIPLSPENQRRVRQQQPWRVVWDSRLRSSRLPLQFYRGPQQDRSIAIHCQQETEATDLARLKQAAVANIPLSVSLHSAEGLSEGLEALSQPPYQIHHLLLEGGSQLASSFLAAGLVDEVYCFISQRFIGEGLSTLGDLFPAQREVALAQTPKLLHASFIPIPEREEPDWDGPDEVLCHGYLRPVYTPQLPSFRQ